MSQFTILYFWRATLLSDIMQVQRGEVSWEVPSHAAALTLRFQGRARVICQVDSHVNALISSHILWLFLFLPPSRSCVAPRGWWSRGWFLRTGCSPVQRRPEGSCPPPAPPPRSLPAARLIARHTCYTFPGVWRWRGRKHPAAQRTSAHTHTHACTHTLYKDRQPQQPPTQHTL